MSTEVAILPLLPKFDIGMERTEVESFWNGDGDGGVGKVLDLEREW